MKKGLFLCAIIIVQGMLLSSCKKNEEKLVEIPNLSFSPKGTQNVTFESYDETFSYEVKVTRSLGKDKALIIKLTVDETKLPAGKSLLSTDYYSFNETLTMSAEETQVTFTIDFKPKDLFENEDSDSWGKYSLPIKIESVTPETTLVADNTYIVINTRVRGSSLMSEGTTELIELESNGDAGVVQLAVTANFSADASKVTYLVDSDGVAAFNEENDTNLTLLPAASYTIGTGSWGTIEVGEEDETEEIDAILTEISIPSSLAKGKYILPLKAHTAEDDIDVEQVEPIYILVDAIGPVTTATINNGDFESPLPLSFDLGYWYYPEDIMKEPAGVWRWKPEWWSSVGGTNEDGSPTEDAVYKTSIVEGGVTGSCLLMECNPGTMDYIIVQKVTGLDPAKMYTLSAMAKVTDVTVSKSAGARIGCWKKGNTDYWGSNASWSDPQKSGQWGEISCLIAEVNTNGEALIALRFGGSSADTDGKAYFDNITISEYMPEVVGQLANGDFESEVPVSTSAAIGRTDFGSMEPGKWAVYNGWVFNTNATVSWVDEGRSGKCIKLYCPSTATCCGGFAQKIIGLTPGDVYTFSLWAKSANITAVPAHYQHLAGAIGVWWEEDSNDSTGYKNWCPNTETAVVNEDWKQLSMDVTVPASGQVIIGLLMGYPNCEIDGTFWFDDITFVKK